MSAAPSVKVRECECGTELTGRQKKCRTCVLSNHPASSQCPFCFEWYWTHRGLGIDQPDMFKHANGRCRGGL